MTSSKLPKAYAKAEEIINKFIDSCICDMQQLKARHDKQIKEYMNSHRKFE
jgi:hypothetical protein